MASWGGRGEWEVLSLLSLPIFTLLSFTLTLLLFLCLSFSPSFLPSSFLSGFIGSLHLTSHPAEHHITSLSFLNTRLHTMSLRSSTLPSPAESLHHIFPFYFSHSSDGLLTPRIVLLMQSPPPQPPPSPSSCSPPPPPLLLPPPPSPQLSPNSFHGRPSSLPSPTSLSLIFTTIFHLLLTIYYLFISLYSFPLYFLFLLLFVFFFFFFFFNFFFFCLSYVASFLYLMCKCVCVCACFKFFLVHIQHKNFPSWSLISLHLALNFLQPSSLFILQHHERRYEVLPFCPLLAWLGIPALGLRIFLVVVYPDWLDRRDSRPHRYVEFLSFVIVRLTCGSRYLSATQFWNTRKRKNR